MSGCDTLLHLFGCEVLIKSESDARRPMPPPSSPSSFVYPLSLCGKKEKQKEETDRRQKKAENRPTNAKTCRRRDTDRRYRVIYPLRGCSGCEISLLAVCFQLQSDGTA